MTRLGDIMAKIKNSNGEVSMRMKTMKTPKSSGWLARVSRVLIFILISIFACNIYLAEAFVGNGQMVYNNNTTTPQARTYTVSSNTFAAAAATVLGGTPKWMKAVAGTARNEIVVAYSDTSATSTLRILYWNGTVWSAAAPHNWTANLSAAAEVARSFDIAVEKNSGDIIVAYTTNAAGTEINFRRWDGTAWTAAAGYDSTWLTGTVRFIKMESKPNSDDIGLIMADTNNDLSAAIWDGTANAWGNPPGAVLTNDLAFFTAGAVDEQSFDLAYESLSGDLLVAYATDAETTGLAYNTYSGGTWSALTRYANMAEAFEQVDCASDPLTDNIICAAVGTAAQDMRVGVWDGAAWLGTNTDIDTSAAPATFVVGRKYLSVGWLTAGATKQGIIVYNDNAANAINWVTVNTNGTFALQTDNTAATPVSVGGIAYHDIIMDPYNQDRLLFIFQDTTNFDIFAKRLIMDSAGAFTWSDANGGAVITAAPTSASSEAFHFAYDARDNTPPTTGGLTFDSPVYTTFVGSPFTFHGDLADNGSAVTACQVCVKNGAECLNADTWIAGTLSGSYPTWTCTATGVTTYSNGGAITSGNNVYIDVRGTSTGGQNVDGGTAVFKTMDKTAPTDGTLTVTPGLNQNALSWIAATDAQSGLRVANTYDVRYLAGTTPPANCSSGTSVYTGTATSYTHTNLTPYTGGYSYRVCAYDNLNNASAGATGTGLPTWSAITTSCGRCHAYPPFDGTARNNPEGAVIGDHQVHNTVCSTCHVVPATETSADYKHRDGNIQMKAGATAISSGYYDKIASGTYTAGEETWAQTNTVTTASCRNIACHGANNPTPQWGVGTVDCTGCHNAAINSPVAATLDVAVTTRRAIVPEFAATWSHKRSAAGAVTKYDCIVCHMEGDMSTGRTSATYHGNGYIELRDPDTGLTIKGATWSNSPAGAGSYASTVVDAKPVRFSRNLASNVIEADTVAIQINQCLKCHDANGATATSALVPGGSALKPFATTITNHVAPYNSNGLGNVVSVAGSFATTNASYHPISGKQNNSYVQGTAMQAPWNIAKTTGNTTSWGYLMTCWDCHAPAGATGVQTSTVTAHGAVATLRAPIRAAGTTAALNLCINCHALAYAGAVNQNHSGVGTSAFGSNGSSMTGSFSNCNNCHANGPANAAIAYATSTARPLRGEDAHGFNDRTAGTPGSVFVTTGSRPYSFFRGSLEQWRPASSPEVVTGSATCFGVGGGCNNNMDPAEVYTPGGAY